MLLALLGGASPGCSSRRAPESGKLPVVASIFPIADIVRQVGGEQVEVLSLLQGGISPHMFAPKPSDAQSLIRSRLLVVVGMGIDAWANQAAEKARAAHLPIVTLTDSPEFRKALDDFDRQFPVGEPSHEAEHHGFAGDPHVWLDLPFAEIFTRCIGENLAEIDPAHAAYYRRQAEAYVPRLRELEQEYRTRLAGVRHREFVTFHEAFSYICRRYGLREYALEDADAQGFGPGQRQQLLEAVHAHEIRAVFSEPQFDPAMLEAVAAVTGAPVRQIDPEGNPAVEGYNSYLAMMRSNLEAFVQALEK
jgi:zinc transport system substrate-binding protein